MSEPIEITPALLAEIEQKAESATPGPWAIMYGGQPGDSYAVIGSCTWNRPICSIEPVNYKVENAQHIAAADPRNVLAMIERIRRLEMDIETLECAALNCTCKRHPMEGAR